MEGEQRKIVGDNRTKSSEMQQKEKNRNRKQGASKWPVRL